MNNAQKDELRAIRRELEIQFHKLEELETDLRIDLEEGEHYDELSEEHDYDAVQDMREHLNAALACEFVTVNI